MPETHLEQQQESPAAAKTVSARGTRIDPPHEFARAPENAAIADESAGGDESANATGHEPIAALEAHESHQWSESAEAPPATEPAASSVLSAEVSEQLSPEAVEQFHIQARQLAAHLETRQRDLDRREAELNAALAQHEGSERSARLWFQERHHDLEDRRQELERRDQQITVRLLELDRRMEMDDVAAEDNDDRRQHLADTLAAKENDLAIRDLELVRRQAELDEHTGQLFERQQELDDKEQKLRSRETEIKSAEEALSLSQAEQEDARRQFDHQQAEAKARLDQQRQQFLDQRKREDVEHQRQTQTLNARWGHLQRRAAALDQSRSEALRLQRETLEMRLTTEELWAQMSGMAPPATITQTLASLRARLVDQQRMELADIAAQRRHVEELAARVAKQHEHLAAQRHNLEAWLQEQKGQLELQTAALAEREEDLRHQQPSQSHYQRRQRDLQAVT